VGHSLLEIVARAFYALQDTRTPVAVGAAAMGLNVVLSLGLASFFGRIGWAPHGGLALANSLATAVECLTLVFLIRRRLGGLHWAEIGRGVLATVAATGLMVVALIAWRAAGEAWPAVLVGLGGTAVGGVVFWLAALLLRAPEARQLPSLLLRRGVRSAV
jgi:putative peptidoglycan lipid II flippase